MKIVNPMVDNISGLPQKIRKLDDGSNSFNNIREITQSNDSTHLSSNNFSNYNFSTNPVRKEVSKTLETNHFPAKFFQNGQVLSKFLERLKLKTLPHITPLLERMVEAENKNLCALKTIDKINRRIKELESHVEKKIKKVETINISVGADITDPNSEEFRRIITSIPTSPFAPTKMRTSQCLRPQNFLCKDEENSYFNNIPRPNGQMIDLTSEEQRSRNVNAILAQNGALSVPNHSQNACFNTNHPPKSLSLTSQKTSSIIQMSANFLPKHSIVPYFGPPSLAWQRVKEGICLQWDMVSQAPGFNPNSYHIFSFQKSNSMSQNDFPWKKIGEVDALALPMACTLTQVVKMSTYFFAVRASICNQTFSPWSNVVLIEVQ